MGHVVLLSLWLQLAPPPALGPPPAAAEAEVHFSPNGGCTAAIVRALGRAAREVRVQAYSFTSAPIAEALAAARRRGVDVIVLLDKENLSRRAAAADFLAHHDIPTRIDDQHAIAHDKVMIVDRRWVVTGSFNFTTAAERRNAENLLVLDSPRLAQRYLENWRHHAQHSTPYLARAAATPPSL